MTLPGHVGGPPYDRSAPITLATLVDWLEEELAGEKVEKPHFAGVSLGGRLALEVAGRGQASSVTAVAPFGCLTERETSRLARRLQRSRRALSRFRPVARALARWAVSRRLLFRDTMHHADLMSPQDASSCMDAFADCPGFDALVGAMTADVQARTLPQVECPLAIVWPSADRLMPKRPYAARFQAVFPDAAHLVLDHAGHLPMTDAPAKLASLIAALVIAANAQPGAV